MPNELWDIPDSATQILDDVLKRRGWDKRKGQVDMVSLLDECFMEDGTNSQTIVAPTGTGKSLGNLIPSLATQMRVVYATSTKALQNQLRSTELPGLAADMKELYGVDLTYAILKGRENYPCIHSLRKAQRKYGSAGGSLLKDDSKKVPEILSAMAEKVESAIDEGRFGELDCEDDLLSLPPDIREELSPKNCKIVTRAWNKSVRTSSGYTGIARPEDVLDMSTEDVCTYTLATAYAMAADIVVMNTALLASEVQKARTDPDFLYVSRDDIASGEARPGDAGRSVVQGRRVAIIDEAHHAPNIVAGSLSTHINVSQLADSAKTFASKIKSTSVDLHDKAKAAANELSEIAKDIAGMCPVTDIDEGQREQVSDLLVRVRDTISGVLSAIDEEVRIHGENSAVAAYSSFWSTSMEDFYALELTPSLHSISAKGKDDDSDYLFDVTVTQNGDGAPPMINTVPLDVSFFGATLTKLMLAKNQRTLESYRSDMELDDYYKDIEGCAYVSACSATIPETLAGAIGLPNSFHDVVNTPFDPRRSRLWVPDPAIVPSPPKDFKDFAAKAKRESAVRDAMRDIVNSANGRSLILTTSKYAAEQAVTYLRTQVEVPVLSQYEGSREDNMRTFSEVPESVFVGTVGFWEGVDIPGDALSAVVVDKILFPHPDDPVAQARGKYVQRRGDNPFVKVSVNHASTMIAQAFGRLIRSVDDKGLVAILDPRVMDTWYGPMVLSQIDRRVPVTRNKATALQWLKDCIAGTEDHGNVDGWDTIAKKKKRPKKRSSNVSIKYKK